MPHGLRIGRIVFAIISLVAALAIRSRRTPFAARAGEPSSGRDHSGSGRSARRNRWPTSGPKTPSSCASRSASSRSGDPTDGAAAQDVALLSIARRRAGPAGGRRAADQRPRNPQGRAGKPDAIRRRPTTRRPSFSFVELDDLKDELAAEQARSDLVDDKLTAAKAVVGKGANRARGKRNETPPGTGGV